MGLLPAQHLSAHMHTLLHNAYADMQISNVRSTKLCQAAAMLAVAHAAQCVCACAPRVPFSSYHGVPDSARALQRWNLTWGAASSESRVRRMAATPACSLVESQARAWANAWRAAERSAMLLAAAQRLLAGGLAVRH